MYIPFTLWKITKAQTNSYYLVIVNGVGGLTKAEQSMLYFACKIIEKAKQYEGITMRPNYPFQSNPEYPIEVEFTMGFNSEEQREEFFNDLKAME